MRPAPGSSPPRARDLDRLRSSTTGSRPFWKQLSKKMSPKLERDDAAYADLLQRPHRPLARAAAAEIVAGEHDLRAAIGRAVEDELGVLRSRPAGSAAARSAHRPSCRASRRRSGARSRMIMSVSMFARMSGAATPHRAGERIHAQPSIRRTSVMSPGDRGGRGHRRAGEMGAGAGTLPADEIAVGGGDPALAAAARLAIGGEAHEQPGSRQSKPASGRRGLAPRPRRRASRSRSPARPRLGRPAPPCGRAPPRGRAQVRDAAVGAGADEDPIDLRPRRSVRRPQPHVVERRRHAAALAGSAARAGSGTRPSTATTCSGLVPQVTCGARAATSIDTSRSKTAPSSLGSVRQAASAASHRALRRGVVGHQ